MVEQDNVQYLKLKMPGIIIPVPKEGGSLDSYRSVVEYLINNIRSDWKDIENLE